MFKKFIIVIGLTLLLPSISYLPSAFLISYRLSPIYLHAAELDEEKQKEKEAEKARKEQEKEQKRLKQEEEKQQKEQLAQQEKLKKEQEKEAKQLEKQREADEKLKREEENKIRKQQEEEAKKQQREEDKKNKEKVSILYKQAKEDYNTGKLTKSASRFGQILDIEPNNKEAMKYLIQIEKEIEKQRMDVEKIEKEEIQKTQEKEKELGIFVGDEGTYLRQGIRLYKIGNYKAAMDKFIKVLSINPYNSKAKNYLKKVTEILSGLRSEGIILDKIVKSSQEILKYKKKEICFAEKNEDLIYSKIIKNAEKSIKIEKGVEFSPTDIQKISENAKEILTIEKRKSRK